MEIHFKIIGILLIVLAIIHIFFPKYFNWEEELRPLSLINRQMMTVHTFFIGLMVFLMGLICLTSANSMIETELGKRLCLGLGIFWVIRLAFQLFVYSKELWKGRRFETMMHAIFTLLWTYLSLIFLWTGLR